MSSSFVSALMVVPQSMWYYRTRAIVSNIVRNPSTSRKDTDSEKRVPDKGNINIQYKKHLGNDTVRCPKKYAILSHNQQHPDSYHKTVVELLPKAVHNHQHV